MANKKHEEKIESKTEIKKLYRLTHDRILGGVCSGMGEYFEVDPTIIRVLYVLVTFLTGVFPGLIAYLVLWIIIPEKPTNKL